MKIKKVKEIILEILFPKKCINCGKEGKYVCKECSLFFSETPFSLPTKGIDGINSFWEYEGLMEKLIWGIKYERKFHLINELIETAFEKIELNLPEDAIITFVPMFKKKEKQRGFNQAELIARKIGEKTGKKVFSLLEKIKDTPSQTKLDKKQRMLNVKDAFIFNIESLAETLSKKVVLVDDVWTSGATMLECVKVLRRAGKEKVFGLVLARVV